MQWKQAIIVQPPELFHPGTNENDSLISMCRFTKFYSTLFFVHTVYRQHMSQWTDDLYKNSKGKFTYSHVVPNPFSSVKPKRRRV